MRVYIKGNFIEEVYGSINCGSPIGSGRGVLLNENYGLQNLKEYIAESHRDIFDLKQLRLMIDLCSTGQTVGMLDLYDFDPHHRRAGVGILVDPLYQKNGLATEALNLLVGYAFSYLKLHQLFVHIPVGNEPSKSLFTRCGFTVTGILTDWITTKDGYSDVLIMQRIN